MGGQLPLLQAYFDEIGFSEGDEFTAVSWFVHAKLFNEICWKGR